MLLLICGNQSGIILSVWICFQVRSISLQEYVTDSASMAMGVVILMCFGGAVAVPYILGYVGKYKL